MRTKIAVCLAVAAAVSVSPALAAKKKTMKPAAQKEVSTTPGGIVGGAVGTAGAVAAGAVGTAGAIATAPFRPIGPVSTINGPSCKPGEMVTIGGQKMRCQ